MSGYYVLALFLLGFGGAGVVDASWGADHDNPLVAFTAFTMGIFFLVLALAEKRGR